MSPKDNRRYNTRQFKVRISKWLPLKSLCSVTKNFYIEDRKAYGRTFLVKKDRTLKKYAVFIRERRKAEIDTDKETDRLWTLSLQDFMIYVLEQKREGISILKDIIGR